MFSIHATTPRPQAKRTRLTALLCALALLFCACGKIESGLQEGGAGIMHSRAYYTSIAGSGKDTWLIMVYMNAADVETEEFALASHALSQLLGADLSDKITVVVQTYGTDRWQSEFMGSLSDRILITADGVQTGRYEGSGKAGSKQMLSDFVSDCLNEFSANRKALFLWGENAFPADDIAGALADAQLDFLALNTQPFTAFEDAYLLRDAADYLIASAGEYAVSWNFAHLLESLAKNTSYLSQDVARLLGAGVLSDDLFHATGTLPSLFCVDLTRMEQVESLLSDLLVEAEAGIRDGKYAGVAFARAAAALDDTRVSGRAFSDALNFAASEPLSQVLSDCLAYASSEEISLSFYLPLSAEAAPDFMQTLAHYAAGGIDHTGFVHAYLTATACVSGGDSTAPWFDGSLRSQYPQDSEAVTYPADQVTLFLQEEGFVLPMSSADEGKVDRVRLHIYADTGEHFLLLGESEVTRRTDSGDYLVLEGRDEWLCINGQTVCSYGYTGADGAQYELVPCKNGEESVCLLISQGQVTSALQSMGVFSRTQPVATGDVLSFSFPIYSYMGDYMGEENYGYRIAVADGLRVTYEATGIGDLLISCDLTDISGHAYTSSSVDLRAALMATEN